MAYHHTEEKRKEKKMHQESRSTLIKLGYKLSIDVQVLHYSQDSLQPWWLAPGQHTINGPHLMDTTDW